MRPGVHFDISNDEYHHGPGISKSGLDLIEISPLHYWEKYLRPRTEEELAEREKQKKHYKLGTALHCAVLEPDTFADRYIVPPEDAPKRPTVTQLNAKKPSDETVYAIGWWSDFDVMLAESGKTVLTQEEVETCRLVRESALATRIGKRVFSEDGVAEASVYWEDPDTGVLCKCRPDWLLTPNLIPAILDLKSTRSAHPDEFMRSAWNYNYHVAAAWYLDGFELATGERPDSFMFLAVEKAAPWAVAWYFADEGMIEAGRRQYRKSLNTYADCLGRGEWPGYSEKLLPLSLPKWAEAQLLGATE
jgi:exodeoxyribonuclease VIII